MRMNKKLLMIIIMAMLVGLVSGCTSAAGAASSWPGVKVEGEVGYFAYGTQVFAINLNNGSLEWRYPSEPDSKTQYYAAPEIGNEYIFAGSYLNTLAAIDKSNGVEKWVFTQALDRYVGSPLATDDFVFAPNADHFIYVLNDLGDLLWKFKAGGPNWTKPLSDGEHVYLASMDHFLYALKMQYGMNELELDKSGSRTLVSSPLWKVDLGAAIVSDPVLIEENIYVATLDGHLFSINSQTGKLNWTYENGDGYRSVWGPLVVADEAVFFGDDKGNIFAVSIANGKPVWAAPYAAGAPVISGGVLTEEGPLFVNQSGRVFIIDINQAPKPVVALDTVIYAKPSVSGSKIILAPASKDKLFMAIDTNGKEIWSFIPSK